MVQLDDLGYRQLLHCQVKIASNSRPPREAVKLLRASYDAASISLPDDFDFAFGTLFMDPQTLRFQ
jgi:hypothetical protein